MDLRYDLETIWRMREAELSDETVIIKLILPSGSIKETKDFLDRKGIINDFVYPEE